MKILIGCIFAFILFVAYVRFLEATTIFLPSKDVLATPRDIGLAYEDVYFQTIDHKRLNGWLVKAPGEANATLIFLHGNAGNIGDRVEKAALFHQMGLNIFLMDYRGYGHSRGRPTEQGMYYDALAAHDYLKSRKDINHDRIISYGVSLGGAAAVDLALRRRVACLIVESSFSSAADMGRVILPFVPSFLLSVKMDNEEKIKKIMAPKLFIHSENDETVPFALGKKLYDTAPIPKMFLKITGSHNDGHMTSRKLYIDGVWGFLNKIGLVSDSP